MTILLVAFNLLCEPNAASASLVAKELTGGSYRTWSFFYVLLGLQYHLLFLIYSLMSPEYLEETELGLHLEFMAEFFGECLANC